MKKLLNLIFLLCICSITNAQKISIGLRGGLNYSTAPLGMNNIEYFNRPVDLANVSGSTSGLVALRLIFDTKKFQLGLSYERGAIRYKWGQEFFKNSYPPINYHAKTGIRQLLVIANIKMKLRRSYLYYGVSVGATSIRVANTEFEVTSDGPKYFPPYQPNVIYSGPTGTQLYSNFNFPNLEYPGTYTFTTGMRPVFGVQVGYTYSLTRHFSLNGELSGRYIPASIVSYIQDIYGMPIRLTTDKGIIHFPVTAGVNYTF